MNRQLKTILLLLTFALCANAQQALDSIKNMLLNAPVQEKVYLHLDNQCYFKGDTIWYKAYVVRADSFTYSDMSHILYVELVSPDGMVVERQNIIASEKGYGDGNFVLLDSIYSGFYEIRAYTRWMLNFCVSEHEYGRKDAELFYNKQMAKDFFRKFDAVYSRVVPVYERPETPGDYSLKYIVSRPKTRQEKALKEKLFVNFYPEGGHLIAGQPCTVAFEAVDEDGEIQSVSGWLKVPNQKDSIPIQTFHQGRGLFTVNAPADGRLKAGFTWHDKSYSFNLPKTEKAGCALHLDAVGEQLKAYIHLSGLPADEQYGVAVLCRGVLKYFETIAGSTILTIDKTMLPTGVCNLIVIDQMGRLLSDRLFFVNHHDYDDEGIMVDEGQKVYEPFQQIDLKFQSPEDARHISIAVRDGATDEPTYDTGNMMTDLLLSSELKGFIAYPDYYFEADDQEHRRHLDLLLMVQGWRRYDYQELTSGLPLRYTPEQNMTIEGCVYPTVDTDDYQPDEIRYWAKGVFGYSPSTIGEIDAPQYLIDELLERTSQVKNSTDGESSSETVTPAGPIANLYKDNGVLTIKGVGNNTEFFQNHGGLDKEVTVEGELVYGNNLATVELETDHGGHFLINVPPYYGDAILFLKAYDTDISDKKRNRIMHKGVLDEEAIPEYYVKRNLFFPVFAKKYNFYQTHQPEEQDAIATVDDTDMPEVERISKMDAQLKTVNVKGLRRRGRRSTDYSKPSCVYDSQVLYNLVTDRGLSFGTYQPREFPFQVSMALLGNYNSNEKMHVMARQNDGEMVPYIYYRNYGPCETDMEQFKSDFAISKDLKLNRQDNIRIFTDFELRNEDKDVPQQTCVPDVTLDFMLLEGDGKRYTYRDRRLILPGMYEPDDFYHPNYSQRPLPDGVKDYRRTLYWNPNASLKEDGTFTCSFFNNSKQTRIKVSAMGITESGKPIYNKPK
jgi:hypothetical protein